MPPVNAGIGGYITRLQINPQYMHDENIIIGVVAFRSSSDNKVIREDVIINVYAGLEIGGTASHMKGIYNITITGSSKAQKINLGKMDMGTWRIKVTFKFADGHIEDYEHSFLISHRPIKYSLAFLDQGRKIVFNTKDSGESFDIEIWKNEGKTTELIGAYSDVSKATYKINTAGAVSVSVFVTDRYNWTNAGDLDHSYIYTVAKYDFFYSVILVVILWIVIITVIALISRRVLKRGK